MVLVVEGVQQRRVSEWLTVVMGGGGAKAARTLCDWPFNLAALDGPRPLRLDEPVLTTPETSAHTFR